jgi:hypothetical protein
MRVLEYRVMTRLDRSRALSLGAALTAAGFATDCGGGTPEYGAPCNPPSCVFPAEGGAAAANAGNPALAGAGGEGGEGEGGAGADG